MFCSHVSRLGSHVTYRGQKIRHDVGSHCNKSIKKGFFLRLLLSFVLVKKILPNFVVSTGNNSNSPRSSFIL